MADKNTLRGRYENAFDEGGIAIINGVAYMKKEDLPSEAELAKGNPERESQAKSLIRAQMLQLQAQAEMLGGLGEESSPKSSAKAEEKEAPKAAAKKEDDK